MALNNGISRTDTLLGELPPAGMISGGSEVIDVPAGPGRIGGGPDMLSSSPDDDFLRGSGNATLRGYAGDDELVVDDLPAASVPVRTALLDGGSGADLLSIDFAPGRSTLLGGGGDDTLSAGYTVGMGGWDPVLLDGGAGDDSISASGCNGATLLGGAGDDTIEAYGDGLVVRGGAGNDRIRVASDSLGGNRIATGAGADVVVLDSWLSPNASATVVTDFEAGAGGDRIDLERLYLLPQLRYRDDPFAAGLLRLTAFAGGTRVELDADGSANGASFQAVLVLRGVAPGSLTADNFVQPVQPLLSGNAALPRAQADKTIVVDEDSAPVALGLSAPVDPDGGTVTIKVAGTPYNAQVLLDGRALTWGSLTADELTRLQFKPAADAEGFLGRFVYTVTDDEGSTVAHSVSFEARGVDDAPTLPDLAREYVRADTPDDPFVLDLDNVAQDPDGEYFLPDDLQFSFTTDGQAGLPGWLQYDAATHVLSGSLPYQGPAMTTIGVTATDPTGLQGTGSFVLRRAESNVRTIQGSSNADSLLGGSAGDWLTGGEGDDRLDGRAGNDFLQGGFGNDTLIGGDGQDQLQGGSGQDHFRFAGRGVSKVIDFDRAQDVLEFDHAVFQALGAPGPLDAAAFAAGRAAKDADDRLLYHRASGDLFYDADGTGAAAPVLVAKFFSGMALSAADLFVI